MDDFLRKLKRNFCCETYVTDATGTDENVKR